MSYSGEIMRRVIKIIFILVLVSIMILIGTTIYNYFLTPKIVDKYIKMPFSGKVVIKPESEAVILPEIKSVERSRIEKMDAGI